MVISSYPMDFSGNVRAKCKKQEYIIYNTMVKRDNCVIVKCKLGYTTWIIGIILNSHSQIINRYYNLGITWGNVQSSSSKSYIVLQSNGLNVGSNRFNGEIYKSQIQISYNRLQQGGCL